MLVLFLVIIISFTSAWSYIEKNGISIDFSDIMYGYQTIVDIEGVVEEEYEEIRFDSVSTSVEIRAHNSSDTYYNFNGEISNQNEDIIDVYVEKNSQDSGVLVVKINDDEIKYSKNLNIEIVVPNKILKSMDINTVSGNILILNGESNEFKGKSVSGNVEISKGHFKNLYLEGVSSNMSIGANIEEYFIKTISGNIIINNIEKLKNLEIESVSGNVKLKANEDKPNMKLESTSGIITVFEKEYKDTVNIDGANGNISIKTLSGSIDVE
jgi:hypothetical protein